MQARRWGKSDRQASIWRELHQYSGVQAPSQALSTLLSSLELKCSHLTLSPPIFLLQLPSADCAVVEVDATTGYTAVSVNEKCC